MKQLIECVPNISEGRDMNIINQVVAEVEKVEGVKLLDVDPGATTNRTVITFVGEPEQVCEAAFMLVKKAQELIDMRNHHGDHHVLVQLTFVRLFRLQTSLWTRLLAMQEN